MERVIKTGNGWRIGWNPQETVEFKGLVGTDDWAIELTESELHDFCRLSVQLAETMSQLSLRLGVPVIVGVKQATQVIRDGTILTLDMQRGLIYSGTVKNS